MGAHQALEHAEHTSHSGGHGHGHDEGHGEKKPNGKLLGLTMALVAVLIAFSAAMVGSERNELSKAMIQETQANSNYTSASTKFRLVMLEMEKLRGTPAMNAPLDAPESVVRKRLVRLYVDYSKERSYSKEWTEAYEPLVEAHFEAAEGYEHAQLIAEIGVVVASLGVLLMSRMAWIVSIVLALVSVGQMAKTYNHTRHQAGEAQAHVSLKEERYAALRKAHSAANEDENTAEALDPGGKIRAEIEGTSKSEGGEKAEHAEKKGH